MENSSQTVELAVQAVGLSALYRMQRILERLQEGRSMTARSMACELQVSRRTVARDIEHMRDMMGIPIEYEAHRHTYVLREPVSGLPAVQVSGGEVLALYLGQAALQALGDSPHAEALAQAIEKLATRLPETVTVDPATFSRRITFEAGALAEIPAGVLEQLTRALRECRAVGMDYFSNQKNALTTRTVHPYHLHYQGSDLYLIGYCTREQEVLMFRVDRIRRLALARETFAEPGFDVEAYLGDSFSVFRGRDPVDVVLHFRPSVARWIREKQWHPSQEMRDLTGEGLELRLCVVPGKDLERWILSFGAEVEVIAPEEMRQELAEVGDALRAMYGFDSRNG